MVSTPVDLKVEKEGKEKVKKKHLYGFASVLAGQFAPLNSSEYFKQEFAQDDLLILIIATDDSHAALIHIKHGIMDIEDIKNKPEYIKGLKFHGRLKSSLQTFLDFMSDKINPIKAVLKGQIKIKGIKKILRFIKVFHVLSFIHKQQREQKKEPAQQNQKESESKPNIN